MYKRVRLRDTVEVPPRHLADVSPGMVKKLLQDKLEGRMDEDVGSVVSVIEVHDIGDGAVLPNKPGVYYEAEFDALTFDPQMQEVVDGEVVEVVNFGAFVGIGPVDGLLHVSQISDEYLAYDEENQQLASRESNRTLTVGDAVRARIVTKSIDERNPRDSKIGLTAKQVGLGKHGWLQEEREKRESTAEVGDS
ncbi:MULTISPECIES: DNA-directed RNA polymerase [Haloarcula]|uniref:DNA-directed RNA polymerase subunit Rpo7 n=1 Tax=Haloarcula pellucida TaxID=1427151 RepID=A0A830GU46_9EURY|nr:MULTISPECIES: DNA-directed RNA polymerase [Halomicroarcula]MBX0349565.1 DNA-directed RNA polymerase [Halomicroarcula pellucida]MDS0278850.1 DNA-directed RNA polymerase [Halomicroarcula sp. S1AR25-4]GGO02338.1 DNA-directed RNA polymerase [Halomicroarcula pellucida]